MRASLLLTSLVFSSVPYGFVRAPLRTYRKHPAAVDLLLADCRMAAIPLKTCFRVQSPSHTCRQHVPGGSASPATPCFRERHYDPNKALKARDWPQRECPGDLAAPRGTSASEAKIAICQSARGRKSPLGACHVPDLRIISTAKDAGGSHKEILCRTLL